MISNSVILLIAVFAALLGMELFLYLRRSRELKSAQNFLRLAKREALETAHISLGNPYPLIQVNEKGIVIFINPAAFEKFPGIREQGLKHPILSGIDHLTKEKRVTVRDIEFNGLIYNQMINPAQVNGQAAFTIYCYDVTERKAYEKKLHESREIAEQARRDAEKANQARGDFLANMSHELRTPMNGIIGLSDILVESGLKPEHQELIEAVNSSAHNLLALLNEILDFSKIEAGELVLESIPFDLRKIIRQVESLQKPVAVRKGLDMISWIDVAVPPYLMGDPSRLQQILNNLIGNALKFTAAGSITLAVSGRPDGKGSFTAQISVTDTGIGISKDQQDKLFKKFQQADISTSRKYGGTGLGLAISKNLAELMGGNIHLQSEKGKGTTFTVAIPLKIAEAGAMEKERVKTEGMQAGINKNARIMVVDDHPVNLLFMRQILGKLGFKNFDEAVSGQQAIDLFGKNRYDLILMDCQMPDMDGYEASKQIRLLESAEHEPAIIAVTANAMKGAEEKCIAAGMDDYISKPVEKEKLAIILHRWLPAGEVQDKEDKSAQIIARPAPAKMVDESMKSLLIFDWDHLFEYTSGDKDTEKMLIDMFLKSLREDLASLQKSYRSNNFREWEATAHKLCGASAHMGACALAEICDEAQTLPAEDAGRMKDLHQMILNESQRLQGLLEKEQGGSGLKKVYVIE